MFGFYRVGAAVTELRIADVDFNTEKIIKLIEDAEKNKISVIAFPELCITGYTCADLFNQSLLLEKALSGLLKIIKSTRAKKVISIVGLPFLFRNNLYNCAAVIGNGRCMGLVPKTYIPGTREFYEKRWFSSSKMLPPDTRVDINGESIPFSSDLIFEYDTFFNFCVEICEDLWMPIPPSSYHTINGALLCLNLSASNAVVTKAKYRKELVKLQSAKCVCGYVYTSSSVHESTTDLLFSGHAIICENGSVLAENRRFQRNSHIIYADIDFQKLHFLRHTETSIPDASSHSQNYHYVKISTINKITKLNRSFDRFPFVPSVKEERSERCMEIFSIESAALAKRLHHTNAKTAVIGVSGGLDSTLALLVTTEAFKILGKKRKNIIAISMPGFGTSKRTFNNAETLCKELGVSFKVVNIEKACIQHFKDIEHDQKQKDITYENVQARERTQILMDIANKTGGLVIGTGDLSEIALGWSTYNGDHMSMYAVNCGVPKTLIRYLISWVAENSNHKLKKLLLDIIDTPVTPELLPADSSGEIIQKTEEIIGPYELHDFFLYHFVKYGASPAKILFLACHAFKGKYKKQIIKKYLAIFIKRFFRYQFKRSCIPDGPKVGTISLSPRGDWRMPSDASASLWLKF